MRITVFGATGTVGREVVAEALARGHEVRASGADATDGTLVQDAPDFPPALRPIALACAEQLAACQAKPDVDWANLSPAASLESGPRTGRYRLGADDLVVGEDGESRISTADLAVALLDEVERPKHHRVRLTVGY